MGDIVADIGAKITLEGEKEFRDALKNINSEVRVNSSALDVLSVSYEGAEDKAEHFTKANKALEDAISTQKSKMDILAQGIEMVGKRTGEGSTYANNLQTQYNKAETELVKLTNQLGKNQKEQQGYNIEAKEGTKSSKELGSAFQEAGDGALTLSDVIKGTAIGGLVADAMRRAVDAVKEFIATGIEYSSSLTEVQNVVDTVFGNEGGAKVDQWAQSSINSMGLASLAAKQYAATYGSILDGMDVTTEKNLEMSMTLTQLTSDWASFRDMKPEEVHEKLRSAITGETQAIKSLGIVMNVSNLERFAMSTGLKASYKDMTEAEKATLRYNYIVEQSSKVSGDFTKNIDTQHNQQQLLEQQTLALAGAFADNFTPQITEALITVNEFLSENGDKLAELGTIVGVVINLLIGLLNIVLAIPMELWVLIGGIIAGVTAFNKIDTAAKSVTGIFKILGAGVDVAAIKFLAFVAILAVVLFLILALKEGTDKAARSLSSMGNITTPPIPQGGNIPAYATGTRNAKGGWALVGEQGTELVNFKNSGNIVHTAAQTSRILSGAERSGKNAGGNYSDHSSLTVYTSNDGVMDEIKEWYQNRRLRARQRGIVFED